MKNQYLNEEVETARSEPLVNKVSCHEKQRNEVKFFYAGGDDTVERETFINISH